MKILFVMLITICSTSAMASCWQHGDCPGTGASPRPIPPPQERCSGSCWADGCCGGRQSIPVPPRGPECSQFVAKSTLVGNCGPISLKEAYALEAAGRGAKVFINLDQNSALHCR